MAYETNAQVVARVARRLAVASKVKTIKRTKPTGISVFVIIAVQCELFPPN